MMFSNLEIQVLRHAIAHHVFTKLRYKQYTMHTRLHLRSQWYQDSMMVPPNWRPGPRIGPMNAMAIARAPEDWPDSRCHLDRGVQNKVALFDWLDNTCVLLLLWARANIWYQQPCRTISSDASVHWDRLPKARKWADYCANVQKWSQEPAKARNDSKMWMSQMCQWS